MELYRNIHEMFKLSFLKHSIHFKILLDIPLWKTNTGKKGYSSFGQILPKTNPKGCSRIQTLKQTLK